METRGDRLRRALAARGVRKQISLAAELGVAESTVSRWQQHGGLSLEHAGRLCDALDISLDWLVLGRGEMDSHRRLDTSHAARKAADTLAFMPPPVLEAINNLALIICQELSERSDQAVRATGTNRR